MTTTATPVRLWRLARVSLITALLLIAACRGGNEGPSVPAAATGAVAATAAPAGADASPNEPVIVVAPGVSGVDEAVVREAFRRAANQAEADYGSRPSHTITVYIDPDSAIGLEDALGLSQKYAIHLRAGRARGLNGLLPLIMHEYTHSLQYQIGRLRPQWWVEGQADFQALRVQDPGSAARQRHDLYTRLAADVRSGHAPKLADLRGGLGWDDYIRKAGAGKAYGWGNAAVAFIESKGGIDAVRKVMTDTTGPNTLSSFDQAVQDVTGLDPVAFDIALKQWVVEQARG
jgi:hypothetical protein